MHKTFLNDILELVRTARRKVVNVVNATMVNTCWEIGRRIVEEEQAGSKRAGYGEQLLKELSIGLTSEFGRGYSERDLRRIRQFYLTFPIRSSLRTELTWTHYRTLVGVANEDARNFYLAETISQSWSVRLLERNIASRYFERMQSPATLPWAPQLKDPFVLEFLGLAEDVSYSESDIESAIIQNIQSFLLELGKGFSFVGRQYRIQTETKVFYIDLVFYHYLLKCFVLIDLKITELTHQDIGQMDMYVRMFEALKRGEDDRPTLGIILCKEKDRTIVKYSMLEESKQLFASSYSLVLPSEDALRAILEQAL